MSLGGIVLATLRKCMSIVSVLVLGLVLMTCAATAASASGYRIVSINGRWGCSASLSGGGSALFNMTLAAGRGTISGTEQNSGGVRTFATQVTLIEIMTDNSGVILTNGPANVWSEFLPGTINFTASFGGATLAPGWNSQWMLQAVTMSISGTALHPQTGAVTVLTGDCERQ